MRKNQENEIWRENLLFDPRKVGVADVEGEAGGKKVAVEDRNAVLLGHLSEVMEMLISLEVLAASRSKSEIEEAKEKEGRSTRPTKS